jgi:chromosome segregation ATPase
MIKPLLENKMKNNKDLLAFHMLSGCTDETLNRINKLLNLTGKDADNANAKSIVEKSHEKEEVVKQRNITQNIEKIKSEQNQNHQYITKKKDDPLFCENEKLRKENEEIKKKLNSAESGLKALKNENLKLKEENTLELQQKLREKEDEIEKLKIIDKDRINLLAEIEQVNKINIDYNNQIQNLDNECLEKDKVIEDSQMKVKELNRQIEVKENTLEEILKKNSLLEQEKENLFIEHQKKVEELQLLILESVSNSMDSTGGLCKVIDILNSNIEEFKNIFKKKIDNFEDIFDKMKSEYNKRDESYNYLLNDKTKEFSDIINNFSGGIKQIVQNMFNNVNAPTSDIGKEIELLDKEFNELTEYKNKNIEYKNKYKELNSKKEEGDKKIKELTQNIEKLKKDFAEKDKEYKKYSSERDDKEKKYKIYENFLNSNFDKKVVELFNQQLK